MCFLLVQIRVRHMKTNTLPYNNNYDNANSMTIILLEVIMVIRVMIII